MSSTKRMRRCRSRSSDTIFREDRAGRSTNNIHVGIQCRHEVVELVPGDAPSARWNSECEWREYDGGIDIGGPFIHGRRGQRFVYLSWGVVSESGEFEMFRRAKLKLDAIDSDMLRRGAQDRARLVVEVNLTDKKGNPACATLRPPQIEWSAEDAAT